MYFMTCTNDTKNVFSERTGPSAARRLAAFSESTLYNVLSLLTFVAGNFIAFERLIFYYCHGFLIRYVFGLEVRFFRMKYVFSISLKE